MELKPFNDRVRRGLRPAHRSFASHMPLPMRRRYLYLAGQKRLPNLTSPRLFTEKINWRIVNDRRPLLAWTCDKLAMKSYVGELGIRDLRIPKTLWHGRNLETVKREALSEYWVLKPNHRSGLVHFGSRGDGLRESLITDTRSWLNDDQSVLLGEWAYSTAERTLLIEENLSPGKAPADYKLFTFDGQVEVIQVDTDRFDGHKRSFFTPDWTLLPVRNRFPLAGKVPRPESLEAMINAAQLISAHFDFLRVDLYNTAAGIWFGEVTPYPGGGVEPFEPRTFDAHLGAQWRLPAVRLPNHA